MSMNNRKIAKISGFSIITMALSAGFAIGYVYPLVYNSTALNSSKEALTQYYDLFHYLLGGIFITIILDFIVSYTLFNFFKQDHFVLALSTGICRLIYTFIFVIAFIFLLKNIELDLVIDEINRNFDLFQTIWYAGLILFGVHLFLLGLVMKKHYLIPNILCFFTLLAGISYIIIHILKFIPSLSQVLNLLEVWLMLPMILGELGLAIWLIVKGGK